MNHPQANNLLDEAREGAAHSIYSISYALFLTGDLSENELSRVNPNSQNDQANDNWPIPSGLRTV
jgi:hypothetical protein